MSARIDMDINSVMETPQAVTKTSFRNAMSSFAGAVNIVTTDGAHGRAGFTATAVCAVTDSPPTLLVCINRESSAAPAFLGNNTLCVNTVGPAHHELAMLFGGKTSTEERFAAGDFVSSAAGYLVLTEAVVSFGCLITKRQRMGTHDVMFCEVTEIVDRFGSQVSVWCRRKLHELTL